jgi:hypothetical protein
MDRIPMAMSPIPLFEAHIPTAMTPKRAAMALIPPFAGHIPLFVNRIPTFAVSG